MLEELVLAVAVVDVREWVAGDADAVVVPDDLLAWERRYGELPEHCAVLALTGWGSRADDPAVFLNADSSAPPVGAVLFVGAPTFEGGSGGPARVFALVS